MTTDTSLSTPRLRIEGAAKRYGGVHALRGVELSVAPGEIHALVGENGAGKSTLMKVLSGAVTPDSGTMWIDGDVYAPRTPRDARDRGVAMIYQELNLCPDLSVLDNVTLGAEVSRYGFSQKDEARRKLVDVLEQLGIRTFGANTIVGALGPGDRQLVEIARALMSDATIIVFDEPTSSLSKPDVERLFAITRRLVSGGVSIIWISHFLDEVKALGNRYTVLRDGLTVGAGEVPGTSTDRILAQMVGREVSDIYPRSARAAGATKLAVSGLSGDSLPREASFELRAGEIFGVFGLVGAGRTEMLRALYGLDPMRAGTLQHDGESITAPQPVRWVQRGVGLLSEDRAGEGLATELSIADNVTLPSVARIAGKGGHVTARHKADAAKPWTERLGLRSVGLDRSGLGLPVSALSGGNQQKVAIARLLHDGADVLLLDEPTRGIDVGAKVEVYQLLDELACAGSAILVISSYLPELFGISDRIAVMHRGMLGPARSVEDWTEADALDEATRGAAVEANQ